VTGDGRRTEIRWQITGIFSYKPIPTLLVQTVSLPKTPSDENSREGQKGGKQKDNAHKTHPVRIHVGIILFGFFLEGRYFVKSIMGSTTAILPD
jgi:hypothetical protein